jgi:AcrR family transcriptional regulator
MIKENKGIQNTEEKILDAAKIVFMENGLDKTRMQDIADRAGISRSALNYYFRTKENLFEVLMDKIFDGIFPAIEPLINNSVPFIEKIDTIIDIYDSQLRKNDFIPRFLFFEFQRNPSLIYAFIKKSQRVQDYQNMMVNALQKEMESGRICTKPLDEVLVTFFSLIFVPYLLNPLLSEFWKKDEKKKQEFFDTNKKKAKKLLIYYFKPNQN